MVYHNRLCLWFIFQFTGVWYGVQSENSIPACEIFKITHGSEQLKFNMNTETRLEAGDNKYRTFYTETLTVPDIDAPGQMSVTPIPREKTNN